MYNFLLKQLLAQALPTMMNHLPTMTKHLTRDLTVGGGMVAIGVYKMKLTAEMNHSW